MKIFRRNHSRSVMRAGYIAEYLSDLEFKKSSGTAGVILVSIEKGMKTSPHAHEKLEEIFIILNRVRIGINNKMLELNKGDVILVEPNEKHWFEGYEDEDVTLLAIKMPNLKDDKIE